MCIDNIISMCSHGSKTPSVLARVQLSMFFDFLYFKPSDNIMSVEPPILLMVRGSVTSGVKPFLTSFNVL